MRYHTKIKYPFWLIVFCFLIFFQGGQAQAATSVKVTGTCNYDYAYQVLDKVNAERQKEGAAALVMDKELLGAAMLRAAECAVSFNHVRPNGTVCFTACDKMYGENIAYGYGTPAAVMTGWMNSSGHKENILDTAYNSIGIGCFTYNGGIYWVQCFGFVKREAVSNPGNNKSTYQISLTESEESKLLSVTNAESESSTDEDTDPLKTKVSSFKALAGTKKLTLIWKKKSGVTGYQIQVAPNKAFKNAESYTVKAGTVKKTITKYNGKKLKAKKKYYIRIRAYISTKNSNGEAVKKYSKWAAINKKTK